MHTTATVGISFGTFLFGFLLGYMSARRGRKLNIDWHLRINTEEFGNRREKDNDGHSNPGSEQQ